MTGEQIRRSSSSGERVRANNAPNARLRYCAPPHSVVTQPPRTTNENNNSVIDLAIDHQPGAECDVSYTNSAQQADDRTLKPLDYGRVNGEPWLDGRGKSHVTTTNLTFLSKSVFDFEEYFGLVVTSPMESLQVRESKGAPLQAGSSPWLQFHLGQSHGFYGTSQKLNVKKDSLLSPPPPPVVNGCASDVVVGTARPMLQKSHSNLETRPYSTSTQSRPKLQPPGKSGSEQQAISYDNLWWIARNEKVAGLHPMQAPPSSRPWDEGKAAPPKKPSSTLPSVSNPKTSQKPEIRMRSAQNRLLGTTRADHGLPIAKKSVHNNYIDLRYPDTIKLGRLGEMSRLNSTLGLSVSYRLGNQCRGDTKSPPGGDEKDQSGATRLKHFGVKKALVNGAESAGSGGGETDWKSRPQTAPDILERLPPLSSENGESGVDKQGANNIVDIQGNIEHRRLVQSYVKSADGGNVDSHGHSVEIADNSTPITQESHVRNLDNSPEPSNPLVNPTEASLESIAGQAIVATTGTDIASKSVTKSNQPSASSKLEKANLSMSNFFCITVDPKSLRNSGICVFSGTTNDDVEFTSADEDNDKSRKVRFSVTNEVHEYQPWEPIESTEEENSNPTDLEAKVVRDAPLKVQNIDFPA